MQTQNTTVVDSDTVGGTPAADETANVIVDIDPLTDPRWTSLHSGPQSSLFASVPWMSAIARTYSFEPRARLLLTNGQPVAAVPYCRLDDIRGPRIVSFPFSDFSHPIGEDRAAAAILIDELIGDTEVRLRMPSPALPEIDARFEQRRDLLWHLVHVDPSLETDERFKNLHTKVRQNLRRAERSGVEVEVGDDLSFLRRFYDLHVHTRARKHRLLPQPFAFFEELHRAFAEDGHMNIVLGVVEGETVAGVLYLEHGDTLYYKFNASSPAALGVRPNELMAWHGIELAASRGLHRVDLGVSDIDQPGLIGYKRKLAHEEHDVVTLVHPGFGPANNAETGRLLGNLTEALTEQDVPLNVPERLSEVLYKYFG